MFILKFKNNLNNKVSRIYNMTHPFFFFKTMVKRVEMWYLSFLKHYCFEENTIDTGIFSKTMLLPKQHVALF